MRDLLPDARFAAGMFGSKCCPSVVVTLQLLYDVQFVAGVVGAAALN